MEEHEAAKPLVAVTNLREFFHDSVQTALRKQRVAVDDHTEHYVVNVLTMFARSEELYESTPEGVRLKPLAHMLADASEATIAAAARRRVAPSRRRLAVHRRLLRAELRAQADRHRLPHRDGRSRVRHARRQHARLDARPGVRRRLPRARAEVPAPRRRAQRSRRDGAHAQRQGHPAAVRDLAEDRQPARLRDPAAARRRAGRRRARARSTDVQLLRRMQTLLAQLYDAPVEHDVAGFRAQRSRSALREAVGEQARRRRRRAGVRGRGRAGRAARLVHRPAACWIGSRGAIRCKRSTRTTCADYCTALEGVSHFHYLVWSLARGRNVSLLELELQAEVDKYATRAGAADSATGRPLPGRAACAACFTP